MLTVIPCITFITIIFTGNRVVTVTGKALGPTLVTVVQTTII